ncbi:hypothetical protein [Rhodanobacter sp. FW106-PBR-R2A-1-13]
MVAFVAEPERLRRTIRLRVGACALRVGACVPDSLAPGEALVQSD